MTHDAVLIIDSDVAYTNIIRLILERAGFDVRMATNAEEGWKCMHNMSPSLAVICLEMPKAVNLIEALPQVESGVECIAVTRYPETSVPTIKRLCESVDIFSYHTKSNTDFLYLTRDVGRALERRALKRQNAYLLTELRDTRDELRGQTEFMVQTERLAAYGQVAVEMIGAIQDSLLAVTRDIQGNSQLRVRIDDCRTLLQSIATFNCDTSRALEPFDPFKLLHEILETLNPVFDVHGIVIDTSFDQFTPMVDANSDRLRQAFLHILLNAVNAMPDGGKLSVHGKAIPGAVDGIRLTFQDTGTGIPPSSMPHLFEPFYTTRGYGRGTGLGLSTVRSILGAYDGKVTISSTARGTCVTVVLPATTHAPQQEIETYLAAA